MGRAGLGVRGVCRRRPWPHRPRRGPRRRRGARRRGATGSRAAASRSGRVGRAVRRLRAVQRHALRRELLPRLRRASQRGAALRRRRRLRRGGLRTGGRRGDRGAREGPVARVRHVLALGMLGKVRRRMRLAARRAQRGLRSGRLDRPRRRRVGRAGVPRRGGCRGRLAPRIGWRRRRDGHGGSSPGGARGTPGIRRRRWSGARRRWRRCPGVVCRPVVCRPVLCRPVLCGSAGRDDVRCGGAKRVSGRWRRQRAVQGDGRVAVRRVVSPGRGGRARRRCRARRGSARRRVGDQGWAFGRDATPGRAGRRCRRLAGGARARRDVDGPDRAGRVAPNASRVYVAAGRACGAVRIEVEIAVAQRGLAGGLAQGRFSVVVGREPRFRHLPLRSAAGHARRPVSRVERVARPPRTRERQTRLPVLRAQRTRPRASPGCDRVDSATPRLSRAIRVSLRLFVRQESAHGARVARGATRARGGTRSRSGATRRGPATTTPALATAPGGLGWTPRRLRGLPLGRAVRRCRSTRGRAGPRSSPQGRCGHG